MITSFLNFYHYERKNMLYSSYLFFNLGPLNAKMDFYEYLGVVRDATSGCIDNFRAAIQGDSL